MTPLMEEHLPRMKKSYFIKKYGGLERKKLYRGVNIELLTLFKHEKHV